MNRYLIALHVTCWLVIGLIAGAYVLEYLPFWPALIAAIAIRMVDVTYSVIIRDESKEETPS